MATLNLRVVDRKSIGTRRNEFLPVTRAAVGEDEIQEVVDCLRSGQLASGPRVLRFEEEFARAVGSRHAISVTNAAAGFHLAFQALGIGAGDEVITPSLTFVAVVNMIVLAGATPVFVDVHPQTLNIDPTAVERAITTRTRAIIPAHFGGLPCDLAALHAMARPHGITVIEDAAHAAGATCGGRPVGGQSDLTVFSFHAQQNMTCGEGGMITTQSDRLAEQLRLMRFHGMDRDAWKRYGPGGSSSYDVIQPGYDYSLTDLQASLGLHQLRKLERHNSARGAHAAAYRRLLSDVPELVLPSESAGYPARHAWHLYAVRLELERLTLTRDEIMNKLREENIGTGLHYRAVHLHPYYRENHAVPPDALPWSERASERLLSLPLFPQMLPTDVDDVAMAVRRVIALARRPR